MNSKELLKGLSQTMIVLGVGLILNPDSARATVLDSIGGESEEVSRPTLLVKSAEQVSLLVKNESPNPDSISVNSPSGSMGDEGMSSSQNRDFVSSEGDMGGEKTAIESSSNTTETGNDDTVATQTSYITLAVAAQNTITDTAVTPEKNVVAQSTSINIPVTPETDVVAQSTGINIPVEAPSRETVNASPTETAKQIAIPVSVEAPQSRTDTSFVAVPVMEPIPETKTQQYASSGGGMPLETGEPVFIEEETEEQILPPSTRATGSFSNTTSPVREEGKRGGLVSAININIEPYEPEIDPSQEETEIPIQPQLVTPSPSEQSENRPMPGFIWPARGVLTSGFGRRWGRMHKGIDIAGPVGTPIVAAADGVVISAGWNAGGYGNVVRIRHFDGTITLYAHNSKILVRRGDYVTQGQQIAKMGSTGFSTGPHLHFEIHPQGRRPVNPLAFLPPKTSQ
ncbi:MAG: peptidoglycan DD-metalloendopeptidase family protein [Geminocystis sp.]|nr:peptidoglycan DD-metalloendopeptidase family protein [Geminocystis sp.]MCS7148105.1 peptidoglycan DD-metalloendopeptidase family protein [Geminocystis sp.]